MASHLSPMHVIPPRLHNHQLSNDAPAHIRTLFDNCIFAEYIDFASLHRNRMNPDDNRSTSEHSATHPISDYTYESDDDSHNPSQSASRCSHCDETNASNSHASPDYNHHCDHHPPGPSFNKYVSPSTAPPYGCNTAFIVRHNLDSSIHDDTPINMFEDFNFSADGGPQPSDDDYNSQHQSSTHYAHDDAREQ
eukprot:CAMPEP_0198272478 /NCGR_PEP_ID=MMETSP1447-20131203/53324_1 /TAXON_ID=420782 /ORGANISM="Chaetoceros dichaeta, Strain CCMP1751" /LENGTH=192 /DNA_ID=CAMNT_0043965663 /DNA_START=114 /DNA_END=692 /DNA_ORIENTATION=-